MWGSGYSVLDWTRGQERLRVRFLVWAETTPPPQLLSPLPLPSHLISWRRGGGGLSLGRDYPPPHPRPLRLPSVSWRKGERA